MPWRITFPKANLLFWEELCVRVICISIFIATEEMEAFVRIIQPEEEYLYRYPRTIPYISTPALYAIAISSVILIVLAFYIIKRNIFEAWQGILVPSLGLPLVGCVTNFIKLAVGRPRPDFLQRCYPGVKMYDVSQPCTGSAYDITEGRKSFPSGHASISFCAFGFLSLYLAGQLGPFNRRGRGQAWRLMFVIFPILGAIMMAVSRTCDYHHHWQDVTVGAIIGSLISYTVYRQYFPSVTSPSSDLSLASLYSKHSTSDSADLPFSGVHIGQQRNPYMLS